MLDERKLQVLYAIIDHYILTGDPIGSRTITKKYDFGLSAATIRNEMSDLEELGFLGKPHTSSGRIPSDKAYRHYVDHFLAANLLESMKLHPIPAADTKAASTAEIRELLELATQMLVQSTQYTAVGTVRDRARADLHHIRVFPVDTGVLLVMLVYAEAKVRNQLLTATEPISEKEAQRIAEKVNRVLSDPDAALPDALEFLNQKPGWTQTLYGLLSHQLVSSDADYVLHGLSNIYNFPEFSEAGKAKDILLFFEDDTALAQLFSDEQEELVIRIGAENEEARLRESAVLTASYTLGDQVGKIALIGPTRMDYLRAMRAIYMIAEHMQMLLTQEE